MDEPLDVWTWVASVVPVPAWLRTRYIHMAELNNWALQNLDFPELSFSDFSGYLPPNMSPDGAVTCRY